MTTDSYLAIDIGASGGRHILGWLDNGRLLLEEIHRFTNGMEQMDGYLCWDVDKIFDEVLTGLKKCNDIGKIPTSVGIDTWGVDYILLDGVGNRIDPTIAYRDDRTAGMNAEVYKCVSKEELYKLTGIQKMMYNTIFQLMAAKIKTPQILDEAEHMLFMPDYLHYKLCGVMKNEYTIASTSGMLNASDKKWDDEIIDRCKFPRKLFGELVPAGTKLGNLTDEVKKAVGFDCEVVMPPSHDTASAFLAVPAKSENAVYISSGTWSLIGVERAEPICSEASRVADFTNEGGYNYRYRYLKNIMGLWILQSVHKEIGGDMNYSDLVGLARASSYDGIFDVNEERFLSPKSMVQAVRSAFSERNQVEPKSLGDFVRCICRSLALAYAEAIKGLSVLTGTEYEVINVIGGGSQNDFLNEMTAKASGLPVYAGPVEGTALGNIASQMIAFGELSGPEEARNIIMQSFDIRKIVM